MSADHLNAPIVQAVLATFPGTLVTPSWIDAIPPWLTGPVGTPADDTSEAGQ